MSKSQHSRDFFKTVGALLPFLLSDCLTAQLPPFPIGHEQMRSCVIGQKFGFSPWTRLQAHSPLLQASHLFTAILLRSTRSWRAKTVIQSALLNAMVLT